MDVKASIELFREVGLFLCIIILILTALWYLFTKYYVQKLLEKSELSIYVHKLQFEKEFEIYLDLWEKIMSVMTATVALRPFWDRYDLDEPERERKQRRVETLGKAMDELKYTVNSHKPFYAPDVFESAHEFIHISFIEADDYQLSSPNHRQYFDRAIKHKDDMEVLLDDICESIRNRIFAKQKR
jgi:hypothetical protein